MSPAVLSSFCLIWLTPAHLLPDNHLERSVQVLVFADRIEIRYHLGLTDAQIRAELLAVGNADIPPDDPAATLTRYQQRIAPVLVGHLTVTVDDRPQEVVVTGVERQETHHVRFVVVCGAWVPLSDRPVRIEVCDTSPRGAAAIECRRMALRGRGDVEVVQCTGQPTLVRVPREPAPAGDFRPDDPSRRIVAVCRGPVNVPMADDTPGQSGVDRRVITGADQAPPPAPQPVEAGPVASADRPSEPAAEAKDEPETAASGAVWFVAVGGGLIFVGFCLVIMLVGRHYREPRS